MLRALILVVHVLSDFRPSVFSRERTGTQVFQTFLGFIHLWNVTKDNNNDATTLTERNTQRASCDAEHARRRRTKRALESVWWKRRILTLRYEGENKSGKSHGRAADVFTDGKG